MEQIELIVGSHQSISPPSSLLSDVDKPTIWLKTAVVKCCNWSPGTGFGCWVQNLVQKGALQLFLIHRVLRQSWWCWKNDFVSRSAKVQRFIKIRALGCSTITDAHENYLLHMKNICAALWFWPQVPSNNSLTSGWFPNWASRPWLCSAL